MIETNFTKLMNRSADLLSEIRGDESQFNHSPTTYVVKCLQLLAPENYLLEPIWLNLYMPSEIPLAAPVGTTVIIHGHQEDGTCYSSTFCHILGYQPKDGGSKHWKMKWGTTLYATSVQSQSRSIKLEGLTFGKKTTSSDTSTQPVG